jgi:hypothetical protein
MKLKMGMWAFALAGVILLVAGLLASRPAAPVENLAAAAPAWTVRPTARLTELVFEEDRPLAKIAEEFGVPESILREFNPRLRDDLPAYTVIAYPETWRFQFRLTSGGIVVYAESLQSITLGALGRLTVVLSGNACGIPDGATVCLAIPAAQVAGVAPLEVTLIERQCARWYVGSRQGPEVVPCPWDAP